MVLVAEGAQRRPSCGVSFRQRPAVSKDGVVTSSPLQPSPSNNGAQSEAPNRLGVAAMLFRRGEIMVCPVS